MSRLTKASSHVFSNQAPESGFGSATILGREVGLEGVGAVFKNPNAQALESVVAPIKRVDAFSPKPF
jgi:hypothetical protein